MGIGAAALLGVVEGITEFLPVSSTAHLKITESLLGLQTDDTSVVAFTAVIQVGAIAAVLVYFFGDIVRIVGAWFRGLTNAEARTDHDYRFAWWVIIATIPIVIVGLAAKPLIEGPLAGLWVVVASLVVGSGFMWWAERRGSHTRPEGEVTFADSFVVGVSQILALLFPGFSRSGASISTGLLRGLDRVAATRLSFFLSIPALTGAGLYELKDAVGGSIGVAPVLVGTAVSFVVAYVAIAWLLRFVSRHDFTSFILYRLALAVVVTGLLVTHSVSP
ncbi:undecaprenyl-diphosphate phosphatase [Nocardioides acrostichi]|uniref:undecaprenyl-diphosphate phosphatase n=1 Tax=Nocardioides acrostichi TaxID=2784339 RepID=UPI002E286A37|nr:undecaprenyl-diphosphate phosphatase [Nocardioides acrostichi]